MLYLISNPMPLPPGRFDVRKIHANELALLIRTANDAKTLDSRIHFASTASAIQALAAVDIEPIRNPQAPELASQDCIVDIRLKPSTPKGQRIGLADLEFYRMDYITQEKISEACNETWPMVLNEPAPTKTP